METTKKFSANLCNFSLDQSPVFSVLSQLIESSIKQFEISIRSSAKYIELWPIEVEGAGEQVRVNEIY